MKPKRVAQNFPVVCVGGSAGGLDAYTRLLQHLPADMGVGIVIVNHPRTVATLLHEILPRYTEMPVELITERLLIQPNHVFIIPERRLGDARPLSHQYGACPSRTIMPPEALRLVNRRYTSEPPPERVAAWFWLQHQIMPQ
jgi:hypothetical protein